MSLEHRHGNAHFGARLTPAAPSVSTCSSTRQGLCRSEAPLGKSPSLITSLRLTSIHPARYSLLLPPGDKPGGHCSIRSTGSSANGLSTLRLSNENQKAASILSRPTLHSPMEVSTGRKGPAGQPVRGDSLFGPQSSNSPHPVRRAHSKTETSKGEPQATALCDAR